MYARQLVSATGCRQPVRKECHVVQSLVRLVLLVPTTFSRSWGSSWSNSDPTFPKVLEIKQAY